MQELIQLRGRIGPPQDTTATEISECWQKFMNYRQPRSFYYLVDLREYRILQRYGMHWLGYDDDDFQTMFDYIHLIPEFQRAVAVYQIRGVYRVLDRLGVPGETDEAAYGFYYAAQRAVLDKEGRCWLTAQTSQPWQIDARRRVVTYLNWFHLLGSYENEGMRGEFFHVNTSKHAKIVSRMNNQLSLEKQKLLSELRFSPKQKDIIKNLQMGRTTAEIAELWELSVNGARYHYNIIKSKLESLFCQKFKTTEEAVSYLARQQILP